MAAIKYRHKTINEPSPTDDERCKAVMRGARRTLGVAPARKAPVVAEIVRDMSRAAPAGLKGLRDRALLLVGFGGAFRRSELVALNVDDITFSDDGMKVVIRRSKTDVEGIGQTIAIIKGGRYCPMRALKEWLDAAGITEGPIFLQVRKGGHVTARRLSGEAVRRVVKSYAGKLDLNPADYSAHSLRSGFLTSAANRGASIWKMKEVSRHAGTEVLAGYVRDSNLFNDHAGSGLL
jgi:integrase